MGSILRIHVLEYHISIWNENISIPMSSIGIKYEKHNLSFAFYVHFIFIKRDENTFSMIHKIINLIY